MGAGVVMGRVLEPSTASAQQPGGPPLHSGPGWAHTSTRASGNGAMDATSRRIVEYARAFSAADLTPRLQEAFANTMLDTIASLVSGFESEPARICARLARAQRGDLRSTVLGYGIVTTPELAAYANSSMIRHTDFNDHTSDMIGGVLAVGEAVHASGTDVMMAIVLAYQVYGALSSAGGSTEGFDAGIYYAPAGAVAAGKLLGLNEDQLANALSLALTMHVPLRVNRAGTLSMQKGCATADAARSAVFAALAAREGMTGPGRAVRGTRRAVGQDHGAVSPAAPAARAAERRRPEQHHQALSRGGLHAGGAPERDPRGQEVDARRRHRRDPRRAEPCGMARDRGSAEVGPAQPRDGGPQPPLRNRPGARGRRDLDRLVRTRQADGSGGARR